MQPEIGYREASSAKHRATSICPANTSGQVQKNAAPPNENPNANSWKTVVRIETKENPAANEAYGPSRRRSCCAYPNAARSCSSLARVGASAVVVVMAPQHRSAPEQCHWPAVQTRLYIGQSRRRVSAL